MAMALMRGDAPSDDAERRITHFIPSVELKGSQAEKLRDLDILIDHLQNLRRRLAGDGKRFQSHYESPSRHADSPEWPWFGAGIGICIACLLFLLFTARGCV